MDFRLGACEENMNYEDCFVFAGKNYALVSAHAMKKFLVHIGDRGNSWKTSPIAYLENRVKEELEEFLDDPSLDEAGDVLNFLIMILDHNHLLEEV